MHKLVILIESAVNHSTFEAGWPDFLHLAESMPGVQRETSSLVVDFILGAQEYAWMHELYFNSLEEARQAVVSPVGQAAGAQLQRITGGRFSLFFADHKEDDLINFRPRQEQDEGA